MAWRYRLADRAVLVSVAIGLILISRYSFHENWPLAVLSGVLAGLYLLWSAPRVEYRDSPKKRDTTHP
jgi:hypothetical protein